DRAAHGLHAAAMRRRPDARERHEAGDLAQGRLVRPVSAGDQDQHLADRLSRQQAVADGEVQRRTLGAVRTDPRGYGRCGLKERSSLSATSCPGSSRASTFLATASKTWMAGTSPAMTMGKAIVISAPRQTSCRLAAPRGGSGANPR